MSQLIPKKQSNVELNVKFWSRTKCFVLCVVVTGIPQQGYWGHNNQQNLDPSVVLWCILANSGFSVPFQKRALLFQTLSLLFLLFFILSCCPSLYLSNYWSTAVDFPLAPSLLPLLCLSANPHEGSLCPRLLRVETHADRKKKALKTKAEDGGIFQFLYTFSS